MKTKIERKNKANWVTGAAGFIRAHLVLRLIRETEENTFIDVDNLNDYYELCQSPNGWIYLKVPKKHLYYGRKIKRLLANDSLPIEEKE